MADHVPTATAAWLCGILAIGCGRSGFEALSADTDRAPGDVDQSGDLVPGPAYIRHSVENAIGVAGIFAEVTSFELPAGVAPDGWLLFFTGLLADGSGRPSVRYSVDGATRGNGGSLNTAGTAGPWHHFDYLVDGSTTHTITVEVGNDAGEVAGRLEELRVVAVPVPSAAEVTFVDEPGERLIPGTSPRAYEAVAAITVAPSSPGDYLVIALCNGVEAPSIATIGVRVVDEGGSTWPLASLSGPRPYLGNTLNSWQSFFLTRAVTADLAPLVYTLEVDASGAGGGATIKNVRLLSMRLDAFTSFRRAEVLDEIGEAPTASAARVELTLPSSSRANAFLVMQLTTMWSADGLRTMRFDGHEPWLVVHNVAEDEMRFPYGRLDAFTTDQVIEFSNNVLPQADVVYTKESVVYLLGLPCRSGC